MNATKPLVVQLPQSPQEAKEENSNRVELWPQGKQDDEVSELEEESDHEQSDQEEESDQDESDGSDIEFQRCEALDALEEAWDASSDSLTLHSIQLDRFTVAVLLNKWERFSMLRQQGTRKTRRRSIQKLVMEKCSFAGGYAVRLMVIFLNHLGDELKKLILRDVDIKVATPLGQSPVGALLGGIGNLRCLESLVIERIDLQGQLTGYFLRCILTNNPDLEMLQLFGCRIDEAMYEQLLDGLKYHFSLRYLDVGELNMNDRQLGRLVDALVYAGDQKKLKLLDISGSSISAPLLQNLASNLFHRCHIQELVMCSCSCSCIGDDPAFSCTGEEDVIVTTTTDPTSDGDASFSGKSCHDELESMIMSTHEFQRLQWKSSTSSSTCNMKNPSFYPGTHHSSEQAVQEVNQQHVLSTSNDPSFLPPYYYNDSSTSRNQNLSLSSILWQPPLSTMKRARSTYNPEESNQGTLLSQNAPTSTYDDVILDSYVDNCLAMVLCM